MDRDGVKVNKHVKKKKRERGQYPAILTEQAWSIKNLLCSLRDTAGSPERGRKLHLARSGSQSQKNKLCYINRMYKKKLGLQVIQYKLIKLAYAKSMISEKVTRIQLKSYCCFIAYNWLLERKTDLSNSSS